MQLFELDADGNRSQLTDLPNDCSGRYLPGTRRVVVQHDTGGDEHMQLSEIDLDADRLPVSLERMTPVVRSAGHMNNLLDATATSLVYSTNRRNDVDMDVVVRNLADGSEEVVYDGGGFVMASTVSHDRRKVAITRLTTLPNSTAVEVVESGTTTSVTDASEPAHHWDASFSADDDAVVLSSSGGREFEAVVRVDLGSGQRPVLVADAEHDLRNRLSPEGSSMVVGTLDDGAISLAVHGADGTLRCSVDVPTDGVVEVLWNADGSAFIAVCDRPTAPASFYVVDACSGKSRCILDGSEALPPLFRGG